jgi:2-polyprenyl-3-methyl-5-hydroxy-6-metoxy-1,4-benzoquinol methylase
MNKCIICRGTKFKTLYRGLLKCSRCGHVFANVKLGKKTLSKIYNTDYFCGKEYNNYLADKEIIQKNFKLRLKILHKFINPKYHKNLLEIGCAYGFFLEIAKNNFSKVLGIDICSDGTNYARKYLNLDVITGDFLKHNFGQQNFDIVCLWDTIEHLNNPALYLNKINQITKKNSLIAITTGDISSLLANIQKEKWRLIHPPTHLHYFSKKTLIKLLNTYGFEVIYCHYAGFYRSVNAIFQLQYFKRKKSIKSLFNKIGLNKLNFYLNLYDILYIIARKS